MCLSGYIDSSPSVIRKGIWACKLQLSIFTAAGNAHAYEEPSPQTVDDFLQILADSDIRTGPFQKTLEALNFFTY